MYPAEVQSVSRVETKVTLVRVGCKERALKVGPADILALRVVSVTDMYLFMKSAIDLHISSSIH